MASLLYCRFQLIAGFAVRAALLMIGPVVQTAGQQLPGSDAYPRYYVAPFAHVPPQIDGVITKGEWQHARWSNKFIDIEGPAKPWPAYRTRMKMQWDRDHLYLLVDIREPQLWATLVNQDDIIYRDHDVEVFIDPDGDGDNYAEIEINALGTVMDLLMDKPYKKRGIADLEWDLSGLRKAVGLKGTLNDNRDTDRGWLVEMAIPLPTIMRSCKVPAPEEGTVWRINFSRVEWHMDHSGNTYRKREGANGKPLPEQNWVWSPQWIVDMHIPENWGYLRFGK